MSNVLSTESESRHVTALPNVPALKFDALWDAIKLGLLLVDEAGCVLLWNDWMSKHSGIPAEVAIGKTLDELFADALSPPFKSALNNALQHRLPIILSSVLHRSPLPLYPLTISVEAPTRIQQFITLTPIYKDSYFCLIQIADASTAFKRERALRAHSEQLAIDANTDGLTGAHNRRFFNERYQAEFGRAQRAAAPISVLMLDLDCFKDYNDSYGHPAGDKVLVTVVQTIRLHLNRATDVLARYGGEEFVVILPDCDAEGAQAIAEKLRLAVSALQLPHCHSAVASIVTLSVGAATLMVASRCNSVCLLETADQALYAAKRNGRNRCQHVMVADC